MWHALNRSITGIMGEKFQWHVLHVKHAVAGIVDSTENILKSWSEYNIGAHLLVGAFDDEGQSLLYSLGRYLDDLRVVTFPQFQGYSATGEGSSNALTWLDYRGQRIDMPIPQSLYHAFEASKMAAMVPSVNDEIELVYATASGHEYFTRVRQDPKLGSR